MTVLEKAKQKRDAAERGMSYGLPGYDRSNLQWWTAYIEGAEDQKREDAEAVGQLIAKHDERAKEAARFDIRQLPEGLYTVKNGVVYTARVKVSGGNVLNLKTGESHWEDDRIVGGEQVFPKRGEIVRCKECRWGHICRIGQHLGLDGFCSKGEREVQE